MAGENKEMLVGRSLRSILVLGAGQHARVVMEILTLTGAGKVHGILDDDPQKHGQIHGGQPILGFTSLLEQYCLEKEPWGAVIGIANIKMRAAMQRLFLQAARRGFEMVQIIHPSAVVAPSAQLGPGVLLGPQTFIGTHASLGMNIVVYSGSTVDHDNQIGDHVFISPGVHTAGGVRIGAGAYLGPGAIVASGCAIGAGTIIGAGSVVLSDIPPGVLAVGAPAAVRKTMAEWECRKAEGGA